MNMGDYFIFVVFYNLFLQCFIFSWPLLTEWTIPLQSYQLLDYLQEAKGTPKKKSRVDWLTPHSCQKLFFLYHGANDLTR
jgi:hypothetical protein